MAKIWTIDFNDFNGGFAPGYFLNAYPSKGKINQAGDMQNVDITDPTILTQGPGLSNLTNGTQADAVNTLIKGILDIAVSDNKSFAVGGNKFYEITASAISEKASNPTLPHTISGSGITAEDVAYYQGEIYYSYNNDTPAGDIGKYDLTRNAEADFDDTYWTSTLSGNALQNAPHPMIVGGDDILYIGNGRYVSSLNGSTDTEQALDLPQDTEIEDLEWHNNRLWIAANRPNITGNNKNISSIYVWDTYSTSWEDEITIPGRISAIKVKNGILFIFYQDITYNGGYKLGYLDGHIIRDVTHYKGPTTPALSPSYYQVSEYKNMLIWQSNGLIYAWGAPQANLEVALSQIADGGYSTVGGIAAPFGTPFIASYDGSTNYKLAKFDNYDTSCYWYSILIDVTNGDNISYIDKLTVICDKLTSNARVDITLKDAQNNSLWTDSLSYSSNGAVTKKDFYPNVNAENFRLEFDWSNGSTSNNVGIRRTVIKGHYIKGDL